MMNKFPILLILLACGFCGCKKNIDEPVGLRVNPALVYKTPSTEKEMLLVVNLSKVTRVLQEIYKTPENVKLVNASIFSKTYTDESVLLGDLIYPQEGRLITNSRFLRLCEKWKVSPEKFAASFWLEANKTPDTAFTAFLDAQRPDSAPARTTGNDQSEEVTIYFPYSENFNKTAGSTETDGSGGLPYGPIATLLTATRDADEGVGSRPVFVNNKLVNYEVVLVDDAYAEINPTQIVGVNGTQPYDLPSASEALFPPGDSIDLPNITEPIYQVWIGDVRCVHQFDALISITGNGGGSEITFTRSDGFLKIADGQVVADNFFVARRDPISRSDINQKRWTEYALKWDGDWEPANKEQYFAIYEEDNRNTQELSASFTSTLKLFDLINLTVGPVNVKLAFKSDDRIQKQDTYRHKVFFEMSRVNEENQLMNGWPVRDKNAWVSYTLPDRIYY